MNVNQTIAILQATQGMRTVKVKLNGTERLYTYKATPDIAEGGIVVCEARDFYAMGTVVSVDEVPDVLKDDISLRWVVQKLDRSKLEEILAEEDRIRKQVVLSEARKRLEEALGGVSFDIELKAIKQS